MGRIFNGTTDLINLASPAALDNIGGSPGPNTRACWIYPTGWGEGDFGRIWDKGTFSTAGWFFYLQTGNGTAVPRASFRLHIGGATAGGASATNDTLALNAWRFIAATYLTGDGGPHLWVGSLSSAVAEVTYSAIVGQGRQDVVTYGSDAALTAYIGNRAAADRTFDGTIAHLSLWDKALSASQLDLLRLFPYAPMHRFSVGGTAATLKGYYPLWESAAGTCLDHTANQNHGTVTGTTVGAEPPLAFTRRGTRATIWTPAAAAGVTYPQLERSRRGLERGIFIGAAS